jgi:PhnB protein
MAVNAYLYFNGNCRQAVEFYAGIFGAEPKIMTYGDTPPNPEFPVSDEMKSLVLHAQLSVTGSDVMFSDVSPGTPYAPGNNISLTISSGDMDGLKTMFTKLKEGGTVQMELQETFWSKCYGSVTDKFGINWQLSLDNSGQTDFAFQSI